MQLLIKLISDTWCTVDSGIVMLEETTHQNRKVSSKLKGCQTMPARCLYTLTATRSVLLSWYKLYMHSPLIKSMTMTHLTVPVFYPHISKLCLIICNEGFKHCNLFRISLTYSFNCWTVLLSAVCKSSPTVYAVLQYCGELSLHNSDVTLCLYRCKCKKGKYKKVHSSLKCIHCIHQSFLYSFFILGLHLHTAYHSNLRTT